MCSLGTSKHVRDSSRVLNGDKISTCSCFYSWSIMWCTFYFFFFFFLDVRVVQCIGLLLFSCGAVRRFTVKCFHVVQCVLLLLSVSVWCSAYSCCWVFPCGAVRTCTVGCYVWCSTYLYCWVFRVVQCLPVRLGVPCGAVRTLAVGCSVWCSAYLYC